MSKLRSIDTSTWSDTWFEALTASEKLLFLYFITNDRTNMVGIYEISIRKISFETGIPEKDVQKHLKKFQEDGKIHYKSNHVILTNYLKHQKFNPNMKKAAVDCYNDLPKVLKIEGHDVLERSDKGFEILRKGYGMVPKIEVEGEEEIEEEIEEEKPKKFDFKSSLISIGVEEQVASDWLVVRKKKNAANTQTAFTAVEKEIEKSGLSANECIIEAVARSWTGFKAEWLQKKTHTTGINQYPDTPTVIRSLPSSQDREPELVRAAQQRIKQNQAQ